MIWRFSAAEKSNALIVPESVEATLIVKLEGLIATLSFIAESDEYVRDLSAEL